MSLLLLKGVLVIRLLVVWLWWSTLIITKLTERGKFERKKGILLEPKKVGKT